MSSVFTVNSWALSDSYLTNNIVKYNRKFYYALRNIDANTAFSLNNFGGYYQENIERPLFLWTPSFNGDTASLPNVDITEFGGFEQRSIRQNNINPISLSLNFNGRDDREACAIIHFLYTRNGTESFGFTAPHPYNNRKIFTCEEWEHSATFVNVHSIKVKFKEVFN